jgi:leader peptidase (prepilin peptidase)/N-methyltransferase
MAVIGAAGFGLAFGSFLNVCILRLPNEDAKKRSLFRPPSSCPSCGHLIGWRDNVPVVSWLILRGRCRWCKAPISAQYPLIELLVAMMWIASAVYYGLNAQALTAALFATILLGIAVIDARHFIIPDELTFGGLAMGLLLSLRGGTSGFLDALLGAAVGFALLYSVALIGQWLLKEEAMGGGDIKMLAMVGAFVGWKGVLITVFLGALVGTLAFLPDAVLLVLEWLKLVNKRKKRHIPFGVFLAIGAAVTFLARDAILAWYQRFLSIG